MPEAIHILGMMSGTSADGMDAALLRWTGEGPGSLLGHWHSPYPPDFQEQIFAAQGSVSATILARLDRQLGLRHGAFAVELQRQGASFDLVAMHGQTVLHQPDDPYPHTLQIGSPYDLAEASGVTVAHDFRRADLCVNGQGAPLTPLYHQVLLARSEPILVLNLGGMANLSWIPAHGSTAPLQAFDSGPGNVLLDAAVQWLSQGKLRFDQNGHWAQTGQVNEEVLSRWLRWEYFQKPPPKSTGRELFNQGLVQELWQQWQGSQADFLATLTALTARSIAQAVQDWLPPARKMLVFGGGARNLLLMEQLRLALPEIVMETGDVALGIPVEALEAMAFAWLGGQCLLGFAPALAGVTGQQHPMVLGSLYPGRNWSSLCAAITPWHAARITPLDNAQ